MSKHVFRSNLELEIRMIRKIEDYLDNLIENEYDDMKVSKTQAGCYLIEMNVDSISTMGIKTVYLNVYVSEIYERTKEVTIAQISNVIEQYVHEKIFNELLVQIDI